MNIRQILFGDLVDPKPISSDILHGPVTPELMHELASRNEEKRQRSIQLLGDKWLLHPNNKVRNQNVSL
jgi:hypothetical protein